MYASLAHSHPHLWSLIYHSTARRLDLRALLSPFVRRGIARVTREFRPDVIVSVLPVINGLLVGAASTVGARVEVVLTDWYGVHPFWQARGVDYYTAPTESARDEMISFGAPPDSVDVVGIPVRREFTDPVPRRGTNQRCIILAMVGAEGSPQSLRVLAHLAEADLPADLVVVCGRNARLRRQIQRLPARMQVTALGYVENVAELMRSADVLLTKAGGVTLAEAFCCGVPVVIHDVLPGQETGNLEYVLRHSAVLFASRPPALREVITGLLNDPASRAQLAERGTRLARPHASREIAERICARTTG
jgi:UDP-N-acetylglucosamine:LPS N-acetylglucosamine transferase